MSLVPRMPFLATALLLTLAFAACHKPAEPPPAQPAESAADQAAKVAETNKAAAMRFMNEAVTGGKLEVIDELVDPAFVEHVPLPPDMPKGIEGLKAFVSGYRTAFPDVSVTVEQITASDDLVAMRSIWKGTHKGDWMGVKATNQPMEFEVFDVVRIKDGKATDHWGMDDMERKMMAAGSKK